MRAQVETFWNAVDTSATLKTRTAKRRAERTGATTGVVLLGVAKEHSASVSAEHTSLFGETFTGGHIFVAIYMEGNIL